MGIFTLDTSNACKPPSMAFLPWHRVPIAGPEEFGELDQASRTDTRGLRVPADLEPGRPNRRRNLEGRETRTVATDACRVHLKPQQPKLFRIGGRLNRRPPALNPVVIHFLPSCEIILFHLSDFGPEFGLAMRRPPCMYAEGNA